VAKPDWADADAGDPGITLLNLFAFLGDDLVFRGATTPAERRRRVLVAGVAAVGLAWWVRTRRDARD
jgi:hypothetical protein